MTDTTTVDVLAASDLINTYGLTVRPVTPGGYTAFNHGTRPAYGETWYAAVLHLAHDNEWMRPSVDVVPMWAVMRPDGVVVQVSHADAVLPDGWKMVPCEVVIRETKGV